MIRLSKHGKLRNVGESYRSLDVLKALIYALGDGDYMFDYGEVTLYRIDGLAHYYGNGKRLRVGVEVLANEGDAMKPYNKLNQLRNDGDIDVGLIIVLPINYAIPHWEIKDLGGDLFLVVPG